MRQMRSAFVELQPANYAVILEVLWRFGLGDAEMLGEAGAHWVTLNRRASAAADGAQQVGDADAQGLAGFDVVVGGLIGIGEQENAGAGWRGWRFFNRAGRGREQ